MKKRYRSFVPVALLVSFFAFPVDLSAAEGSLSFREKASYSIGLQIGGNLKRDHVDLDREMFAKGLAEAFVGGTPLISNEDVVATLREFQRRQHEERTERNKNAGDKNRVEGAAFLAKNRTVKGVITTESGLQYQVIKKASGPSPHRSDEVKVHYRGTLLSGEEFDSSYRAGEPAVFGLESVIPGWTEGLQKMALGSTYRFFIPPHLAYGAKGAGNIIGPNATLIFEVELLDIKTGKK